MEKISIAIVDNDMYALQVISLNLLRASPRFRIAWQTRSAAHALHRCLFDPDPPQVLIVDMVLEDMPGLAVCEQIRRSTAQIGLVGITSYPLQDLLRDASVAGAQALLAKEHMDANAVDSIVKAAQGLPSDAMFLDSLTAHQLLNMSPKTFRHLTAREKAVLCCFDKGMPIEEICDHLGISRNTVFTHTRRALRKLDARNRNEALSICRRYHLLEA